MAKMFYTLEETAQLLGLSEDEIRAMGEDGRLQQFRDRDKLMFKREQIDEMASEHGVVPTGDTADPMAQTVADPLAQTMKADDPMTQTDDFSDTVDLASEAAEPDAGGSSLGASASATGISVFDTDEIAAADPMAQTQVTSAGGDIAASSGDSELTLESVGSGSGLLDLTHEPDETSLGAMALLDDIGEESESISVASASASEASGDQGMMDEEGAPVGAAAGYAMVEEAKDPAGDMFGGFMLFGVLSVLVIALMISISSVQGVFLKITAFLIMKDPEANPLTPDINTLYMWAGVMFGVCFLLGIIGFFLGKSRERKMVMNP